MYSACMRDRAVREKAGISLRNAARTIGVHHTTLYLYEASPDGVQTPELRDRIGHYYDHLRAFLAATERADERIDAPSPSSSVATFV